MSQCKKIELLVPKLKLIRHAPFTHVEHRLCVLRDDCTRSLVCAREVLLHYVMQRSLKGPLN